MRPITRGAGFGPQERALEASVGSQAPRRSRPSLPLARRETGHGQAGFRLRLPARRGTRGRGTGIAIHGLTPSVSLRPKSLIEEAGRPSATHTIAGGHRAFDILHVAHARLVAPREFFSFDAEQLRLAKAAGLLC